MKIKITHLGSTVKIDEQRNDKTTINYEHDKINGMITNVIGSITDNPPKKATTTNEGKPALVEEIKKEMNFECVNTKTLEPLEIPRNAKECLRMLSYWDENSMMAESGGIVHSRVGDSNTMKVVKTFLNELIDHFPKE